MILYLKKNASSRNSLSPVQGTAAKSLLHLQHAGPGAATGYGPMGTCAQMLVFHCPLNLITLVFTLLLAIAQDAKSHTFCILLTEWHRFG